MTNEVVTPGSSSAAWKASQVYAMAVVCLLIGLAVGYLFRGSRSPAIAPGNPMRAAGSAAGPQAGMGGPGGMPNQQPTLEQMKQMADKRVEPILDKLKDDPKNADLLNQAGNIYLATHQFKEAADYYSKSLEAKPKDVKIRVSLASCLFYTGDADGALKQLTQAAADDPNDANTLFNLGMIRLRAKKDSKGALAAWAQLLKTNPELDPNKRAQVEKLMADVRAQSAAN
ncbi:MAG: tetratricopeptide repeat protein [Terriglobales bacterium]|jgi:cytochrome c-type biogenesis protein CcmH/NrfG